VDESRIIVSHRAIQAGLHRQASRTGFESMAEPSPVGRLAQAIRDILGQHPDLGNESSNIALLSDALTALDEAEQGRNVLTAVQHPLASLLQSYLAEKAKEAGVATIPVPGGFEAKFDDHDILGWVGSFFTWWRGIRPHAWQPPPATPDDIGPVLRVGILGDWGTGMYGAPHCASSIKADPKSYGLLLHLGDVYYSGTQTEVRHRFLDGWPEVQGSLSRALNSNHEMYTGGHAYFNLSLARFNQSSSCFALRNDHWLLVGLDSAYAEHDLAQNQAEWLTALVETAGTRKLVLFSHHQPYSLFDKQGPKLVDRLSNLLEARRIFAWYWGHEHRCVIYDRHPLWGLAGRCIGHSGYPYFRVSVEGADRAAGGDGFGWFRLEGKNLVPGGLLLDGPNPYVEGDEERYGPNGYATLEFDREHLTEFIHAPDGRTLFQNVLN
jgi:hypothetical protein